MYCHKIIEIHLGRYIVVYLGCILIANGDYNYDYTNNILCFVHNYYGCKKVRFGVNGNPGHEYRQVERCRRWQGCVIVVI